MADADSRAASDASQSQAEANVTADIDTGEAFKQSVFNNSQAYAFNLKELQEKWSNFSVEQQRSWAELQLTAARNAQTMWEDQHAELMKDLAEIRGRRMHQFDLSVVQTHNKEEEVQDDIATNVTLQKLIDALEAAKKV
ncbi:MAG: hypothetical protein ACYS8I_15460 [Planctomycetota bacterium]|jgi:hypothetical protein